MVQGAKKVGRPGGRDCGGLQEQAQGIDQINKAVAEMDKVTQQNAANAEEIGSGGAGDERSGGAVAGLCPGDDRPGEGEEQGNVCRRRPGVAGGASESPAQQRLGGGIPGRQKMLKSPGSKGEGGIRPVKAAREGRTVHVNPLDEGDFKEF